MSTHWGWKAALSCQHDNRYIDCVACHYRRRRGATYYFPVTTRCYPFLTRRLIHVKPVMVKEDLVMFLRDRKEGITLICKDCRHSSSLEMANSSARSMKGVLLSSKSLDLRKNWASRSVRAWDWVDGMMSEASIDVENWWQILRLQIWGWRIVSGLCWRKRLNSRLLL